jgi:hypothetical protein
MPVNPIGFFDHFRILDIRFSHGGKAHMYNQAMLYSTTPRFKILESRRTLSQFFVLSGENKKHELYIITRSKWSLMI